MRLNGSFFINEFRSYFVRKDSEVLESMEFLRFLFFRVSILSFELNVLRNLFVKSCRIKLLKQSKIKIIFIKYLDFWMVNFEKSGFFMLLNFRSNIEILFCSFYISFVN